MVEYEYEPLPFPRYPTTEGVNDELVRALRFFGHHTMGCVLKGRPLQLNRFVPDLSAAETRCDCGLAAVVRRAEGRDP